MNIVKKVIGRRILVAKINAAKRSSLFMPDETVQKMFMGIVLDVGDDVKNKSIVKDSLVFIDATKVDLVSRRDSDGNVTKAEFIVDEDKIILIRSGKMYYPLGYRILVRRINNEIKMGNIIIPSANRSTDQSTFGVVYQKGIVGNRSIIDVPFHVGDIVKFRWDVRITEVDIDNEYFLSVPLSLLEFSCSEDVMKENFVR